MKRFIALPVLAALAAAFLSCQSDSPFDPASTDYVSPEVTISDTQIASDDSTALEQITITVEGNKPEVEIRYKLDDKEWSGWQAQGTLTISGYGTGSHIVSVQGRYGEGGEFAQEWFHFVKVEIPRITDDSTAVLADSALTVMDDRACTLSVAAAGTPPLTYRWYRDTTLIDTVSGDSLIIGSFSQADTGAYFCIVTSKWGQAVSDTLTLSYRPRNNTAPAATGEKYNIKEDSTFSVSAKAGLLVNDSDADGDSVTVQLADSTTKGTLVWQPDGAFSYTPDIDFAGADSFSYKVKDSYGAPSAAVWTRLTVSQVNDRPKAVNNLSVSLDEDSAITITFAATDPEGSTITEWRVVDGPSIGVLSGSGSSRIYTPKPNENGSDTIRFQASDGELWSDTGIVAIMVNPVDDAPVWKQATETITTKEGLTASVDLAALFDNDPDGDSVTFSKESGKGKVTGTTWEWTPLFTDASAEEYSVIIRAVDNGTPAKSSDITLGVTVVDSVCKLTIFTKGKGGITVTPDKTTFTPGDNVRLVAIPEKKDDYAFREWQGDVGSVDIYSGIISLDMNQHRTLTAVFIPEQQDLDLMFKCTEIVVTDNYIFAWKDKNPPALVRLNRDSLTDQQTYQYSANYSLEGNLAYSEATARIYAFVNGQIHTFDTEDIASGPTIQIPSDVLVSTGLGSEHDELAQILTDGNTLYAVYNRLAGGYRSPLFLEHSRISEYDLSGAGVSLKKSSPNDTSKAVRGIAMNQSSIFVLLASDTSDYSYSDYHNFTAPWVAAYNKADLSLTDSAEVTSSDFLNIPADSLPQDPARDFAVLGGYLWFGMGKTRAPEFSGAVFKVNANNLQHQDIIQTVKRGRFGLQYTGYCNGVWKSGNNLWVGFDDADIGVSMITPAGETQTKKTYWLTHGNPVTIVESKGMLYTLYYDKSSRKSVIEAAALTALSEYP